MKKTCAILWCLVVTALLAGACNYDAECWAPGEGQGAGVGGGVITPGAGGGYGAEPNPEPQGDPAPRWNCKGPVTDCTCDTLPGITLACPFIHTIQPSEKEAKDEGKTVCAIDLAVKLLQSNPDPKAPTPKCFCAVSAQTCVQSQGKDWSCTGRSSCKRGASACKTPDEVWDGWCGWGPGEAEPAAVVQHYTAEDARGVLLKTCEEELAEDGGGAWFCMPGTVRCVEKALAHAWICKGPVAGCTGSDDTTEYSGGCGYASGVGATEAEARLDALEDCEATLDSDTPGKWWDCTDGSTLTCAKAN